MSPTGRWPGLLVPGLAAVLVATSAAGASSVAGSTTPVQKVIELLKRLREQVLEEGKQEAIGYDKFACFCKEQADNKVYALDKSGVKIEALQAAVADLGAEITQLDSEMVELRTGVATEDSEANTTSVIRQAAVSRYVAERANLTDGVVVITAAIESLRASRDSMSSSKAAAALSQVRALLKRTRRLSLSDFSQQPPGTPQAYKYRSNDVITTLQDLLKTFKGYLETLDTQEASARHEYEMLEGARAQKVAAMKASMEQKETLSSQRGGEKSDKEKLLGDETAAKGADQAFLDQLTSTCQAKAKAWDSRSQTRASEITTMTEALGLLEGAGGLYSVNKRLTGLLLKERRAPVQRHDAISQKDTAEHPASKQAHAVRRKVPAFLQLLSARSLRDHAVPVVGFLEERARTLKSATLAQLVLSLRLDVAGPTDHFERVRVIIKDLVARLEAEATAEADSKSFCDTEMAASLTKRDERAAELESLAASIESTSAEIRQLEISIAELGEQIAALYKARKEMAELRSAEKAANAKSVADADAGAAAVQQAITVLKVFYQPAATGLLQEGRAAFTPQGADREGKTVGDLAPEAFSGEYAGKQTESRSIFGLLEVITSDFQRTSSTTQTAEIAQEDAFQRQKTSTESEIQGKETEKADQESAKGTKVTDLVGFEDSRRQAVELHKSALRELEVLKSSCVDSSESWEERKARREKEIEALKRALQVLEEWRD